MDLSDWYLKREKEKENRIRSDPIQSNLVQSNRSSVSRHMEIQEERYRERGGGGG